MSSNHRVFHAGVSIAAFALMRVRTHVLVTLLTFLIGASTSAAGNVDQQIAARHAQLKTASRELKEAFQINLQSYKTAMVKALDEALPKILDLQSTHIVQNCVNGVNRAASCALLRISAIRVVEKSFEANEVGRTNNSYLTHAWTVFDDAAKVGTFEPVPIKPHEVKEPTILRYLYELATFEGNKFENAAVLQREIADAFLLHRKRLNAADTILLLALDDPLRTFSQAPEGEKFDLSSALKKSFSKAKTALKADNMERP